MECNRVIKPAVIEVVKPESETFDLIGLTAEQMASTAPNAGKVALGISHKIKIFSDRGDFDHSFMIKRGSTPEFDRLYIDTSVIENVLTDRRIG